MAVIKHISVKGSNGGDALNYVLYKHNEKTGEMIVDGRGNPIMRDEYYLDGINCEPYSFAAECKEVNDLYGKNQLPGDIKAHHFIISYDPIDGVDHGLAGPKAQQLSMEWAERCLPGFQILVCTHMDGSNESGNIHTHIMMNSLRKYDTDSESFGEREIDYKAGYKLHLTDDYLRYMKQELMTICEQEGLYQIDLLSPAKDRITNREYRAKQNGQDYLDKQSETDGKKPEKTTFQTQKQYLREAVMNVAVKATSFDEFCAIMKEEYDITVKESRGRISYLHPNREKYITGRALGLSYEKQSVVQIINGEIEAEIITGKGTGSITDFSLETMKDCKKVFEMHSNIHLVVQLQDSAKAKISVADVNKETLKNLKMMAETVLFVQHNGYDSLIALEKEIDKMEREYVKISKKLVERKEKLKENNEIIHYLGQYLTYKNINLGYIKSRDKKGFKLTHKSELDSFNIAADYLKQRSDGKDFPKLSRLREDIRYIRQELDEYETQINNACEKIVRLKIASNNIKVILGERGGRLQTLNHKKTEDKSREIVVR